MTKLDALTREAQNLPDPLLEQALDFIRFLKIKHTQHNVPGQANTDQANMNNVFPTNQPPAKWLTIEEDEAWQQAELEVQATRLTDLEKDLEEIAAA